MVEWHSPSDECPRIGSHSYQCRARFEKMNNNNNNNNNNNGRTNSDTDSDNGNSNKRSDRLGQLMMCRCVMQLLKMAGNPQVVQMQLTTLWVLWRTLVLIRTDAHHGWPPRVCEWTWLGWGGRGSRCLVPLVKNWETMKLVTILRSGWAILVKRDVVGSRAPCV